MNGRELAAISTAVSFPDVRVYATRFIPNSSNLSGKNVEGVRFQIVDRERFSSIRLGLELAVALETLYPGKIDFAGNSRLIGSNSVVEGIRGKADPRTLEAAFVEPVREFLEIRKRYLLYQ